MTLNPYETLGVTKSASPDEIKNAYRNLAKKYHPDLNPGNKGAEKRFKEINSANELLSDPEMKGKFDRGEVNEQGHENASQQRENPERGPYYQDTQKNGGRYSFNFGNMDSSFFESLMGENRGQRRSSAGQDVVYQMEIEFPDAILGKQKEITLPNGKTFQVQIPAGIESGAKLRFRGQGASGQDQGPAGDLYIEVKVKPSLHFRRVGKDIEFEVPVAIHEAILGGEIKVSTLSGSVMLKIPPGVNTGSKLRIRGKGVPGKTPQENGDQITTLKVMLPEKIDPELESAMRNWSKNHAYDPRSGERSTAV